MNLIEAFKVGTPIRRTGRKYWMVKDKDGEKEINIDPEQDQWVDPMHFLKFIADSDDVMADDYEAAEKRVVITEREFEALADDLMNTPSMKSNWRIRLGFDK